jgi:long-chain acyl-CoA synthetase
LFLGFQQLLSDNLLLGPVVRERFGGRLKFFVCGGAPLSGEIAEFLHALGLLVLEGYGLTENAGAANVNRPDNYRFGTVGPPIPGVEERVAPDGEILIRGRNVMLGYHGLPDATREVLDEDGWLHTGDIGRFESDGFLRVTDRKKDIIVTSGGKNVAPQNIETMLRSSPYIDQALVHGDGRKYLTALVSLDLEQLQRFAEEEGIPFDRRSELLVHPRIRHLVEAEIEERNRQLSGYETLRRFTILPEPLSLDAGEITPTMKLRRQQVEERYRDLIEAMYDESEEKSDEIFLGER